MAERKNAQKKAKRIMFENITRKELAQRQNNGIRTRTSYIGLRNDDPPLKTGDYITRFNQLCKNSSAGYQVESDIAEEKLVNQLVSFALLRFNISLIS